ncbi:MAG: choice-of-anchor B domain-containing protein [Verrucomicrobiales bacterium]|jgi:choice-of-anchor B domain-containing protein
MPFRFIVCSLFWFTGLLSVLRGACVPCVDGLAGVYPCYQVDLLARVIDAHMGSNGRELNDLWGWTDPVTGTEYALVGLADGTSFVDLSDPESPVYIGKLPTHIGGPVVWRDIKTYADHAFIVADHTGELLHGMQVFDLNQLRAVTNAPVIFAETAHYGNFSRAHNIVINEESGFAYAVGLDAPGTTCNGGLHMIDIRDPVNPVFAGCFSGDGYTHDAQAVMYLGPDTVYAGREIVFASNEDTLTIVDVTDKSNPAMLSRTGYAGARYTHQCWVTEDHRFLLMNDEDDEKKTGVKTRTHIWNVENLDAPIHQGFFEHTTAAIDHNLYIRDRFAFMANYTAGLRILDLTRIDETVLKPVAYFDSHYTSDAAAFSGAWSVYPYFQSGVVLLSDSQLGLFVLKPRLDEIPDNRLTVRQVASENPLVSTNCPSIDLIIENTGTNEAVDVTVSYDIDPYSLELIDQFDAGEGPLDFGGGAMNQVEHVLPYNWLTLDAQGAATGWGTYTSRVMDAKQTVDWNQLSWKPALPYGKELVASALTDYGYPGVPVFGSVVFHLHPTEGGFGQGKSGANLIFHLNESPATNGVLVVDASGRGNHGSFDTGGDLDVHSLPGKFHSAIAFDGDDRILFDAPLMYTNGLELALSCWVKTAADGTLLAQTAAGESNRFELAIISNRLAWVKDDLILVHATNTVTDGKWHHLAATRGAFGDVSLYFDGAYDTFGMDTNSLLETNAVLAASGTNAYFVGVIDELALYQVSFTEDNVRELYTRGVNRILFQLRSSDDPSFAGVAFAGPGGVTNTFFSEALNPGAGLPDFTLLRNHRYLQYRIQFETDDPNYTPKLLNVRLGPEHVDPATGAVALSQGEVRSYDPLEFNLGVIPGGSNAVISLRVCMPTNTSEQVGSEAILSWISAVSGNSPLTNTYTLLVIDTDGDQLLDFVDPDDDNDGIPDVNDLPDLSVSIAAQPEQIVDDPSLTYSLTVANAGTDTADAISLQDLIPADVQILDYRLVHPHLVAMYDFNEGPLEDGGLLLDHSGHARHGTIHTGLPGVDQSIATVHGRGIQLDGANDYIELPSFTLSTNYTISLWFNHQNIADSSVLLSKADALSSLEFNLGVFNRKVSLRIQSNFNTEAFSRAGPQHLVLSIVESNGVSRVTTYRDGVFLNRMDVLDVLGDVSGGTGWILGKIATANANYLAAIIDHLSFFDAAFTPGQVSRLYALGPVGLRQTGSALSVNMGPIDTSAVWGLQLDAEVLPGAVGILTNLAQLVLLEPDASNINHSATNILIVVDTDSDGSADFVDLDDDGDSMLDSQEQIAGTDSKNAASRLALLMSLSGAADPVVGFDAVTGRVYRIERRMVLDALDWTSVQSNLTGNGWVQWPQTHDNLQAFFRLGVEKQP